MSYKNKSASNLKQPKVFYLSTITSLLERHGYFVIASVLTLYIKNVYNYSDQAAFSLFALYMALGFIVPVAAGYLSDNITGIKRCMGTGLILDCIGFILLAMPQRFPYSLHFGLAFLVIGSGLFKTCPTNLLARGYTKDDPRTDSGFTLFYVGINIGGFVATIVGGAYKIWGWNMPFVIAAVGMTVAVLWFFLFKHQANDCEVPKGHEHFSFVSWCLLILLSISAVFACGILLINLTLGNILFYLCTASVIIYFIAEIVISPKNESKAIFTCLILMIIVMLASILYFQMFTSMSLFIERCIWRTYFKFTIPTVWYLSLSPVWIFILSPFFAHLYKVLASANKDLPITFKLPIGVMFFSAAFFIMSSSTLFATTDGKISSLWVVVVYSFSSAGELLSIALGFSMIAKISPPRLYGIMTGAWYLITSALAVNLSGIVANMVSISGKNLTNIPEMIKIYHSGFMIMGIFAFATAITGFAIAPWLTRMNRT